MRFICIYKEASGEIVFQIEDMTKKQYEQKLETEAFDSDSNFVAALRVKDVLSRLGDPSADQTTAGEIVANEMDWGEGRNGKYKGIVKRYLSKRIRKVDGIYLAMLGAVDDK